MGVSTRAATRSRPFCAAYPRAARCPPSRGWRPGCGASATAGWRAGAGCSARASRGPRSSGRRRGSTPTGDRRAGCARAHRRPFAAPGRPTCASAVHHRAAVGVECLARDERGVARGQEDVARGNLLGLSDPAHRGLLAEVLDLAGGEAGRDERRPYRAGRDRVHADAALGERDGERARERDEGAVRGRVVDQRGVALVGGDRARVDDRATLGQVGERRPGQVEDAEHVGAEGLLELVGADVLEPLLLVLLAGVVDEHVERTELRHGALHGLRAERLVADIAGDGYRASPLPLDERLRLLRILVLVEVGDRHVAALAGEENRHRAADPAVAAGDKRDLAVELAASAVLRGKGLGPRLHLVLEPRLARLLLGGTLLLLAVVPVGHRSLLVGVCGSWAAFPARGGSRRASAGRASRLRA